MNDLSVLAGNLGGEGTGDGVPPAARLTYPAGIARGADGELYVADSRAIRRFNPTTGEVVTVIGREDQSGTGDGVGSAARFGYLEGLAADDSGNLFVADGGAHTIRKIVLASKSVTTLAGSPGVSGSQDGFGADARFYYPQAVALDGAGDLFVSDLRNYNIRKIVLATGQVTLFAGGAALASGYADGIGTAARFYLPEGLAADRAGHLFVSDALSNTLRRIDLATALVTTIAGVNTFPGSTDGTGTGALFHGPRGLSLDGTGRMYVADAGNQMVRQVDLTTLQVGSVAGAPDTFDYRDGVGDAARFDTPSYVFSDGRGRLYVSDAANSVIRAVDVATRTVTTVAGKAARLGSQDGTGSSATLGSIGFTYSDGQGSIYMTDTSSHTVRKVAIATGTVTTIAGLARWIGNSDGPGVAARFYVPMGLVGDGAGSLYIADSFNSTIRRIDLTTGDVTTVAGVAGQRGSNDGVGTAARLNTPSGMTTDGVNVYFADQGDTTIRQLALATMTVTTLAGAALQFGNVDGTDATARFQKARAIVCDGLGNLYIADSGNNAVRKLVLATKQVTTCTNRSTYTGSEDGPLATATFFAPFDLAIDSAGHLYVADYSNHLIRRIDIASGTVSTVAGVKTGLSGVILGPLSTARLSYPMALSVLPGGGGVVFASERALLTARF